MTRIAYAASLALSTAILVSSAPPANAATYSVLFNFSNKPLGEPAGRIYIHGSLFGTGSGYNGFSGQVFELTKSNGTWNSKAILKFDNTDGAFPLAGLVPDAAGSLYGTAGNGDIHGHGNVFKLTRSGNSWAHSTLWAFGATGDGQSPSCDLVMDSAGNIYGTTSSGGSNSQGTAFELSFVNGNWTETILHSFGNGNDGTYPVAGLLLDKSGALYGTTNHGGTDASGTVFELKKSNGVWNESVLHSFAGGSDGGFPLGILIEDSSGNLYGTTEGGGTGSYGTAFEMVKSGGVWTEQVLYSFTGGADGGAPQAGLHSDGNYSTLVGTTEVDGASGGGTAFKLSKSGGVWNETTLHAFGSGTDGHSPDGQIVRDSNGNLYGTTFGGGTHGNGTVWEITP
ncbi:MAG TPA: choice-of-anchor tandem repeat GloVer-containing protein [Rhizomicrobium sp.]|jgi:uncharacterized repeat protein (TIGR03803 family)|nr:choice-of-anchor tandem repeat GloVer-containing protein [Rhizomicrobium sp.]